VTGQRGDINCLDERTSVVELEPRRDVETGPVDPVAVGGGVLFWEGSKPD
jgi:hypothetical protein